jgi:hypothetical protein
VHLIGVYLIGVYLRCVPHGRVPRKRVPHRRACHRHALHRRVTHRRICSRSLTLQTVVLWSSEPSTSQSLTLVRTTISSRPLTTILGIFNRTSHLSRAREVPNRRKRRLGMMASPVSVIPLPSLFLRMAAVSEWTDLKRPFIFQSGAELNSLPSFRVLRS